MSITIKRTVMEGIGYWIMIPCGPGDRYRSHAVTEMEWAATRDAYATEIATGAAEIKVTEWRSDAGRRQVFNDLYLPRPARSTGAAQ